jgi:NAD(P)-dependent dehydrogenase (short-subunit alcohol dehydrogenase family)
VPAKFGLVAYSEMLHAELALRGAPVGVTVLTPSGLRTPLLLGPLALLEPGSNPALEAYYAALVEAAVEPADFAELAVRAIKTSALYVNSHRATLDAARERLDRMFADTERIGTIK